MSLSRFFKILAGLPATIVRAATSLVTTLPAPMIAFSPRKAATVLYGLTGFDEAKVLLAKLGKHSTGKGCLYIKKLADVEQPILENLIVKSLAAKRASSKNQG